MAKARRKLKLLEMPSDPALLAEMLAKLKDKEIRLEADLAIKEHPAVHQGITEVVLALSDVDRMSLALQAYQRASGEAGSRADVLLEQIERYTAMRKALDPENPRDAARCRMIDAKLATLEAAVADAGGADRSRDLRSSRDEAVARLRETYFRWLPAFTEHHVDLPALVFRLRQHVEGAEAPSIPVSSSVS